MKPRPAQPGAEHPAAHVERAAMDVARRLDDMAAIADASSKAELGAIAAAAVAHEVRNILTPVRARLELALLGMGDGALVERSLREALQGVERAGRAAEAVLSVVAGRVEVGDGADVAEATTTAGGWIERAGFKVVRDAAMGVRVAMAPAALEQVMMNLLLNARSAVGQGLVYVRYMDAASGSVVIEVEDHGTGAAGGLFDSQANAKRGGLGLIVCRHLVEAVGGSISARSRPGDGTTVRVELPRAKGRGQKAA